MENEKYVEIIFKNNKKRIATVKQFQFILGIKNIKDSLFTYKYI
ncbi:hypothetical protein [uncultured Clostridium sp.]|nr:hypothetical protein [uncultured Clostridium sp.]